MENIILFILLLIFILVIYKLKNKTIQESYFNPCNFCNPYLVQNKKNCIKCIDDNKKCENFTVNNINKKTKPFLWMYFESKKNSRFWPSFYGRTSLDDTRDYIKLAITTVYQHCNNDFYIVILNEENVYKYLPEFEVKMGSESTIPIEKRSFYLSLHILNRYGGLWLKPAILFKPIKEIVNMLYTYDFVGFACNPSIYRCTVSPNSPNIDIYGSKPNSEFLNTCIKEMAKIIHSFNYPSYEFLNIGRKIFNKYITQYTEHSSFRYFQFGPEYIGSRDYDNKVVDVSNLLSINNTLLWKPDKALLIIVDTNGIDTYPKYRWFQRMSKKQILESNLWISKLFRNSLKFEVNNYFDVDDVNGNRLLDYKVNYKPTDKADLKKLIYNSNMYFVQPWNQVYNSSSRNS